MLFRLSDTLISYSAQQQHVVLAGVTNLLVGYFEGKNLLIISDKFYDHFTNVLSDERALLSLRHLHSYTTYDYKVSRSFIVKLDGTCRRDELLIDYFYNTTSIQPVQVIGENTNDVEFYAIVTRIIRHVDSDHLSYNPVLGGGYTTSGRLKKCQDNNEFALCIVDSDIKYPKALTGATYGELLSVYDSNNKHVLLVGIKVHEIENLLPPCFIKDRSKDNGKALIEKIIARGKLEYLRWYDIKNGVSVEDLKEQDYNVFANEMYNVLYKAKAGEFNKHVATCTRKKMKILPAIGNDLVKKFLKLPFEKQYNYKIYFKKEWEEIANNFYDFSCSRECGPIYI